MKQILIVPDRNHMQECLELSKKYNLGFEYNDFYIPDVLDSEKLQSEIIKDYKQEDLPKYCTMHGAFFDVIPFSADSKIKEISRQRIQMSLDIAGRIGAQAVIFHTNYNPFLGAESYVTSWLDANAKYWSQVLEQNSNIKIYLENMFDTTPDILLELSKRLCKYANYGVCLDWSHASISKTEPTIWAEKLGAYVKHVHINDNDLIQDLHLAWGDGKVDREAFYQCYEKYMPHATVLVETSSMESKIRSLERLEEEGFLK